MRKILTSLLLCAAAIGGTMAQQVEFYDFEAEVTGTYSPLEGATVIGMSDKVKGDAFGKLLFNETDTTGLSEEYGTENPAYMAGIPFGFDFKFGKQAPSCNDGFVDNNPGYDSAFERCHVRFHGGNNNGWLAFQYACNTDNCAHTVCVVLQD